ncbi:transposase [Cedecea sp. P7760]|uniref:RNA-guided endonuclease InsQ/TnpB family protein n=1 Tax=Cedecea sp. P7760 TaxID=2726983 RepID=UPI002714CABC|nr:transposase [Cedecea sp. P7760]
MSEMFKTLSLRVKDRHARLLIRMSREVNQVFNLVNEISCNSYKNHSDYGPQVPKWLSAFELQKATSGIQKINNWSIGSSTVQEAIAVHAKSRNKSRRSKLRWRISHGSGRSLGWVPFKSRSVTWSKDSIRFAGYDFKVWDTYGIGNYDLRSGCFSEDRRGRWYLNICVKFDAEQTNATSSIGIDLGLKDVATTSTGMRLSSGGFYRQLQSSLGVSQRARKKSRVRSIHAKIKNRRKDAIHKFTTELVNQNAAIFVGDVSSTKLVKTKMAKSVLDAGWSMLKTQLEYKAIARSVVFEIVNENYSTQACSCCGCISENSPKGRTGLRIREWTCVECGETHDRDINAAMNILAAGHRRLAVGTSVFT